MLRVSILSLSVLALLSMGCEPTKSADKNAEKKVEKKVNPKVEKTAATSGSADQAAAKPAPAKPAKTTAVPPPKRDPECQAAVDALKALKAGGKAKPEEVKAATMKAMQTCIKTASANAPKPGAAAAAPAKPVEPATAKGTPPKGLEGRWTIDPDGLKELPEFKKLPEQQRTMALAMFKNLKMEIAFGASEIAMNGEFMGQKKAEKTPFKVVKTEGKSITIETDKDGKKQVQVLTPDGDRLSIKDGGKTIVLKRVK